ncbi:HAD-IC family P-type ATPase [bacterium]|nr:HAD-IC family P-type ATPase [bacterium]
MAFSIIISMFVLSGLLKFVQDFKARKTCEKLNDIVNTTAAVVRNNQKSEIDMEEIVPGDIIYISAGDMVPADMRLLSARDLFVTQSPITGESEPVEKIATKMDSAINNLLDCKNLCFMGTTVASGYGYGIAIQTGNNTFFGRIANLLTTKRDRSSFNKGIRKVSFIIIITMLVMSLLIFLINGILKTNIDNK